MPGWYDHCKPDRSCAAANPAAFPSAFDAGRLWSGTDNDGDVVHWATGGGLRLQQGRAFVVRADVAWSPDARPVAGYLLADHIF